MCLTIPDTSSVDTKRTIADSLKSSPRCNNNSYLKIIDVDRFGARSHIRCALKFELDVDIVVYFVKMN